MNTRHPSFHTETDEFEHKQVDQPTCLRRKSCKIFLVFGCMALILEF
uniref:Uncharacterized protein n=1 Tax=Arundo donax TaxID=35708 RepID=A0A0A9CWU1_ARUDO